MSTKEYHKVSLYRETATLTDEFITPGAPSGTLKLGASGNFGVHCLQVELGEGWQDLIVRAIFWLQGSNEVVGDSLLSGGEIQVPAAVTASSTDVGFVTFSGTSAGVNRLTATLPFIVTAGPPSEGEPAPEPDPSLWQQLFEKMEEVVSSYILPIMSEETLGGGRAIKKTTETVPVAVDPLDGRLYVPEQSGGGSDYKLPQATESTLGGVKAKQRTSETLEVAIDSATGKLYVPQQGGGGSYVLPVATEGVLGGVKAPAKTSETVKVVVDADGFLYVKDYAEKSAIPTKTSQLSNDSGFLTEEKDPTVPSWAKQPQKPTYTAEEVGAQAKGDYALKNEIPTKLPNPQVLTFTGAVNQTYDGSSAVTVNIPEGGEGGGDFDINTASPDFEEAETRENINTGETVPVLFGKIKKWFSDLKPVSLSGEYKDLNGQPQSLKNPQALTFTGGSGSQSYDGSVPVTIKLPEGAEIVSDFSGDIFKSENIVKRDNISVMNGTESTVEGYFTFYVPMSDVKSGMIIANSQTSAAYYGTYKGSDGAYTYTQKNTLGTLFPDAESDGVYVSVKSETFPDFYINAKNTAAKGRKCEYAGFEAAEVNVTFSDKSLFLFEFQAEPGTYLIKIKKTPVNVVWGVEENKYWPISETNIPAPTVISEEIYTIMVANSLNSFGISFRGTATNNIKEIQEICKNGFELYKMVNQQEVKREREKLPIPAICHMCNFKNEYMISTALGWHGIELDVKKTLDGVFVLSHEDSVSGKMIATTNYAELLAANKQLSTLEECLKYVSEFDVIVDVHLSGLEAWDRLKCLKAIQSHNIYPWYYTDMEGNIGDVQAKTFYQSGMAMGVGAGAESIPKESSNFGKFVLWKTPEPQSSESVMHWMFINDSATDMGYEYLTETDFEGATYFFGYRKSSKLLYK